MTRASTRAQTMSEKVWERHVVHRADGEPDLLYIDLHLIHEVTSPQAFDGLRLSGRTVRRPDLTVATMDHNVPTTGLGGPIEDPVSAKQIDVQKVRLAVGPMDDVAFPHLLAHRLRPGGCSRHGRLTY